MAVYQLVKNWLPNPDRLHQPVTQASKLHLPDRYTDNEASRAMAEGIGRVGVGRTCSMVRHHTSLTQERLSPVDPVKHHGDKVNRIELNTIRIGRNVDPRRCNLGTNQCTQDRTSN
jgi:hypothetical protein